MRLDLKKIFISQYLILLTKLRKKSNIECRKVQKILLYYRICDHGYPKNKPDYITKEKCLKNAIQEFPLDKVEWMVYADNICDETYNMIRKYIPKERINQVSIGHGAGTFRMVYEEALKNDPNDLIYFLEDDYLHLPGSLSFLLEAAKCNYADYFTLYDHPDKYGKNSPNPFVKSGGEKSIVYWCNNHHWKVTNSTTMTFAAFVDVLKRDKTIFWRWTETKHPFDFQLFSELKMFGKRLLCAIPGLSTHGETDYLSLGIDWRKV